jgi:hypothetical protein
MKTTIEVPDELYRRAKAEAALRGRRLKDLFEEGLRRVLEEPQSKPKRSDVTLGELMKDFCGIVDSGVDDLATNPKYFADFGQDAFRDP